MRKADIEEIVDSLDLKGVGCPYNYVRAKIRLEEMEPGQLLEIIIDEGEPIDNVPPSLIKDGHDIERTVSFDNQSYRLLIRKGVSRQGEG